ncbi:MAG: tetraacyldisaccharide 4'-kinase [Patescibacteria group bacterium]
MILKNYFYDLVTDKKNGYLACGFGYRKPNHGFLACVIKFFLLVLSWIYSFIIRVLIFFYSRKPYQAECKVISVGNITWGGAGKTPLVESIARHLKEKKYRIAILSRGYKRKAAAIKGRRLAGYEAMGDEPYMLSKNLSGIPIIVDANRMRALVKAHKECKIDIAILDDGFQQWGIKKDLEVVVVDATEAFGNRQMIPRGILREPLSSLRRADIFVLTKIDIGNPNILRIKDFLNSVNPKAEIFESVYKPIGFCEISGCSGLLNTDALKGKTVTVISGIANPGSFEHLLLGLGINIGLSFRFPDHFAYRKQVMDDILKKTQEINISTIITTEKDLVRIPVETLNTKIKIFALRIELKVTTNEKEFFDRISDIFTD